jgi:hypothetical protein
LRVASPELRGRCRRAIQDFGRARL